MQPTTEADEEFVASLGGHSGEELKEQLVLMRQAFAAAELRAEQTLVDTKEAKEESTTLMEALADSFEKQVMAYVFMNRYDMYATLLAHSGGRGRGCLLPVQVDYPIDRNIYISDYGSCVPY